MPNPQITNVDTGSCVIDGRNYRDEIIVFAAERTYKEGTLFARRAVGLTPTIGAWTRAGSSNGTLTAVSVVPGREVPLPGNYTLLCIGIETHGAIWQLKDPNGRVVAGYLRMTPGAGGATVFKVGGLQFTLTDGSTDFGVGDTIDITVTADGKLVPFSPGGAGGAQNPIAVLAHDAYKSGAGNAAARVLVGGTVNQNRLIIDADGNGSNITAAILDQLRAAGVQAERVEDLSQLDNQ